MAPFRPGYRDSANEDDIVAIVLGGGRGTRLYPLTSERAKPAVPMGGRYRLVDIPLSNCINAGINRIFVLTQFNSRSLHRHIMETYKFDVFSGGFVEMLAAEQTVQSGDWFQGTADAIRQNLWHLRNTHADHYLILSGDHLYRMDYAAFVNRHLESGADITVSTLPCDREAAKGFGIMKVEQDGRITEFVEKPQTDDELAQLQTPPAMMQQYGIDAVQGKDFLASMGVYVFKADVMRSLLESRPDWVDFGKHVIPKSLKSHKVYAYPFDGFWEDIGTVRSFYEVSLQLTQADPPFDFMDPSGPIYSRPRYLPGSRMQGCDIRNSIVCEGTRIQHATIENSIIGIRSAIGDDVRIRDAIVMGADFFEEESYVHGVPEHDLPLGVGNGTVIERAIIDKNARIGRNVVIRGSEDLPDQVEANYAIIDGIVMVLKNAVLPDGTVIGQAESPVEVVSAPGQA
jgi:glucose-1-phosphate adenylyltransferase